MRHLIGKPGMQENVEAVLDFNSYMGHEICD